MTAGTAPPFKIFPRDAEGKPGPQYRGGYPLLHVISAINICRAMLQEPTVRNAFKTLAVRYSIGRPNVWYRQPPNPIDIESLANGFIDMVYARFPIVFVDYEKPG